MKLIASLILKKRFRTALLVTAVSALVADFFIVQRVIHSNLLAFLQFRKSFQYNIIGKKRS